MMSHHRSLVVFTLLLQSAVGTTWCAGILFISRGWSDRYIQCYCLAVALLASLIGLCASMAHPGKPMAGLHFIRNLNHSWLSRELAATGIFVGILAVAVLFSELRMVLSSWAVLVACFAGVALIYIMAQAYRLRTVPSWNHAGTPLSFLSSALLLGGIQFALAEMVLPFFLGINEGIQSSDIAIDIALAAVTIGFLVKIWGGVVGSSLNNAREVRLSFNLRLIVQEIGFLLWVVSMLKGDSLNIFYSLLLVAAVFLITGEILERTHFYATYRRTGL
jgi:anaerobic dimethyl sulfoxide reductase subunit C (anchor subunit)